MTELGLRTEAFIDGRYAPAANGRTFDCVTPRDGTVLAQIETRDTRHPISDAAGGSPGVCGPGPLGQHVRPHLARDPVRRHARLGPWP